MKKTSEIKHNSNHQDSHMPGRDSPAISQACNLLRQANVRDCLQLSNASNYVFLATMIKEETEFKAIYKPRRGEIPLWDFPDGTLYKRECAAFILSQALEWYLIPPTVIRSGPYGIGSMQWFVDTIRWTGHKTQIKETSILKQVALFDYLVNNADRKASHFLAGQDGRLWLVDHGLTFNAVPKLRTVLWNFSGETIRDELLVDVKCLQSKLKRGKQLRAELRRLIAESEIKALEVRIDTILEKPVFVSPGLERNVPWLWY
jgi:hypothetical protein